MGELAALGAALAWAVASILFERFGRSAGGLALNAARCVIASIFFFPSLYLVHGVWWPQGMESYTLGILALSGFVGLTLGDTLWLAAILRLGARRSLLLVTVTPLLTALAGTAFLGEPLTGGMLLGMVVTLAGILWVILERTPPASQVLATKEEREDGAHADASQTPIDGVAIFYALASAACQAAGNVMTKLVGEGHSAVEVSVVRLLFGTIGIVLIVVLLGRVRRAWAPFSTLRSGTAVVLATFMGTFVGVWLMNAGLLGAPVGVASTLNATSPLFVLPFALMVGERVSLRSTLGALIAILGVALLFWVG